MCIDDEKHLHEKVSVHEIHPLEACVLTMKNTCTKKKVYLKYMH
jgi:hypothetical protein